MSQHRHLYNTARWQRLRAAQLRAHPLCRMHGELGRVVAATVADHINPHRGDEVLFFDAENLQSLCKPCHDSHKQAQEHSPGGLLRGASLTGVPLDRAHPWHQAPRVGGGQISTAPSHQTALVSSFAECQNSEGGASA